MTKKVRNFKELVQYSSEYIQLNMNLTENSTANCDYHDETKQLTILFGIKVRFFVQEVGTGQKFVTF